MTCSARDEQSIEQPLSQRVDQIPLTYHLSEVTIPYGMLTIDGGKQGPEAEREASNEK
ncbi:hypothetical protein OIN60_19705 [Paenibacillus sp. P96]|uniref:Uncharacterized protein n=1 Tax=Paenibacillus zeirhizosphaerae TaxID=2987519 RepID=A0ABT9FW45_9BACL|nr:hypothetical protein [Paenibacillus sp. P96]MDP4098954.1 hypothetical protein [Paenibacillus sp. P96]